MSRNREGLGNGRSRKWGISHEKLRIVRKKEPLRVIPVLTRLGAALSPALVIRYARRRAFYPGAPGAAMRRGFLVLGIKSAVLIDGGHLRALSKKAKKKYEPDFIEAVARSCVAADETLFRILYYDCAMYKGTVKLPVSAADHIFTASDQWLRTLAAKDLFAVRRGVLKFRGWKPKKIPIAPATWPMPISIPTLNRRALI